MSAEIKRVDAREEQGLLILLWRFGGHECDICKEPISADDQQESDDLSTTAIMNKLSLLLLQFSEAGFHYVAQASLELPVCSLGWSHNGLTFPMFLPQPLDVEIIGKHHHT